MKVNKKSLVYWLLGLVVSFIIGYYTNYLFYYMQITEGEWIVNIYDLGVDENLHTYHVTIMFFGRGESSLLFRIGGGLRNFNVTLCHNIVVILPENREFCGKQYINNLQGYLRFTCSVVSKKPEIEVLGIVGERVKVEVRSVKT